VLKDITYISNKALELKAYALLAGFESQYGKIHQPPIPIDQMIEFYLDLDFDWDDILDTEEAKILGCLDPKAKKILMNSRHVDFFNEYWGTEAYTKAHEVGHWDLHVAKPGDAVQLTLPGVPKEEPYLCRQNSNNIREIQAERYAAYLLMPDSLLKPAIHGLNLATWKSIYSLKDNFGVSVTAMKKRLVSLNLIYIGDDDKPHLSQGDENLF